MCCQPCMYGDGSTAVETPPSTQTGEAQHFGSTTFGQNGLSKRSTYLPTVRQSSRPLYLVEVVSDCWSSTWLFTRCSSPTQHSRLAHLFRPAMASTASMAHLNLLQPSITSETSEPGGHGRGRQQCRRELIYSLKMSVWAMPGWLATPPLNSPFVLPADVEPLCFLPVLAIYPQASNNVLAALLMCLKRSGPNRIPPYHRVTTTTCTRSPGWRVGGPHMA